MKSEKKGNVKERKAGENKTTALDVSRQRENEIRNKDK